MIIAADKYRVLLVNEYPDYINAVYADVSLLHVAHKAELGIKSCTLQGYKHRKAYIIAEGPMASTVRNMWKVIYDKKCGAIVMLSQCNENEMVRLC